MRRLSGLLALVAALSVVLCAGCLKVNMDVAVAPDQSTSARLSVATDISLAEMPQAGPPEKPFAELVEKSGGKWTTREYKEGDWQVYEATGQAGPGEALFQAEAYGENPQLRLQTAQRRLSTRYDITLIAPPPAAETGAGPKPEETEGTPEMGGELDQALSQAVSGLAASMAQSVMSEFGFRFSLKGPGEVVATTGRVAGPGQAEWELGFADLQEKKALPDFRLTTEMPNWRTIGNLADQLVMRGGPSDAGSRLAVALQRGLLPNPPLNAPAAEKLSAIDYLRLLAIIGRIDSGAGLAVTDVIIKQARLNDQDATSARIEAAHDKIMKMDIGLIVEQAAIKGISGALR